uniref:Uncharacterized protein n=1 Tax=Fagus sylvatica TaxID=28930 RepID=A0A2N9ELQ0_FAGSY
MSERRERESQQQRPRQLVVVMLSDGGTRWLSGELGHGWSGENSKKKEDKRVWLWGCGLWGSRWAPSSFNPKGSIYYWHS